MSGYDVIVVGAGPAGSAAAWAAATRGARVLILDKARFPRDKTCGDGLTPAAVRVLDRMALGAALERFHVADRLRFHARDMVFETAVPQRRDHPGFCYVVPRVILDELLLRHAAAAGAEVLEETEVTDVLLEEGRVAGVVAGGARPAEFRAPLVIAADGARSVLSRLAGARARGRRPLGVAVRAQTEGQRADSPVLEVYFDLTRNGRALPGYGWVFPMGDGRFNVGVGMVSVADGNGSKSAGAVPVFKQFLDSLPPEWRLPSVEQLRASGRLRGSKLPMGFSVWPPWRPGILFAGDAAGVANPLSGAGISKALQSGVIAGSCAADALDSGGPTDLRPYETTLRELWGARYRRGRWVLRAVSHEKVMTAAVALGVRMPMKPLMLKAALYGIQRSARPDAAASIGAGEGSDRGRA